ncbi:MAG: molecular chaperone GroEL [Patescibacteria group bacterium]
MKNIIFGDDAREKLKKGVDLIANAVKVTLGPRGRNMIYGFHYGFPICTKDGVTVARQVEAKDQAEQLGLLLVRQAAQKTADDVGDGTTTVSLLVQEIFSEGLRVLKSGANPILIKRGIDKAVTEVIEFIKKVTVPVEGEKEILKVATLSANNDAAIGELINDAVKKAGKDGVITIEDNYQNAATNIEVMEGMQLNEGLLSLYFITNREKMEAEYRQPYVIIFDGDIHNVGQVHAILEKALKTGRPVVLMANNVHGMVLQTLVQARIKNNIPLIVVKSPYFGDVRTEQLADLGVLLGGRVMGPTTGLRPEDAELTDLGECENVRATRFYTTFVGGKGTQEETESRISMIRTSIEKSESDYDKDKLRERLSKLTNGVVVIKVGAPTEVEQKEKKMRIEDALLATRAAMEEGIVPGGGVTLLKASLAIQECGDEEELIGRRIVRKALRSPLNQIAANAGVEGAEIIAAILSTEWYKKVGIYEKVGTVENADELERKQHSYGYNFLTNTFGDLIDLGVVDPAKVVKATVINAASIAGMLLTTEVICSEESEDEVLRTPRPKSQ